MGFFGWSTGWYPVVIWLQKLSWHTESASYHVSRNFFDHGTFLVKIRPKISWFVVLCEKTILEGTGAFSHPHGHGRYPPSFVQLFFDSSHSTNGYYGGPTEKRSLLTPTLVNSVKPHFTLVINPLWPNGQCNRGELPHDPDFFDRFSRN